MWYLLKYGGIKLSKNRYREYEKNEGLVFKIIKFWYYEFVLKVQFRTPCRQYLMSAISKIEKTKTSVDKSF